MLMFLRPYVCIVVKWNACANVKEAGERKFNPDECAISRISEHFPSALYIHFIKIWRSEQLRVQSVMITSYGWEWVTHKGWRLFSIVA